MFYSSYIRTSNKIQSETEEMSIWFRNQRRRPLFCSSCSSSFLFCCSASTSPSLSRLSMLRRAWRCSTSTAFRLRTSSFKPHSSSQRTGSSGRTSAPVLTSSSWGTDTSDCPWLTAGAKQTSRNRIDFILKPEAVAEVQQLIYTHTLISHTKKPSAGSMSPLPHTHTHTFYNQWNL